jgi:long-chain acyl-CoA synthetase
VAPQTHIALCAAHGPEWIVAALATIAAGAVLVPVDPQTDPKSLSHIMDDCGATLWFTSAQTEKRIRERGGDDLTSFVLDAPPESPNSWHRLTADGTLPSLAPSSEDTAVLFYTSGTTGMPKGVPLSHRNLMFQVETLRSLDLVAEDERVLLTLPMHHVYPFSIGLLGVLAFRCTAVIPRALTGPEMVRAMRDGGVTTIIGVPRLYEVLLSGIFATARSRGRAYAVALRAVLALNVGLRRWFGVRSEWFLLGRLKRELGGGIRNVVSGGAALDERLAARLDALGWNVASGYGLTETAPLLTLLAPGDRAFSTVGKPVSGVAMRISPIPAESSATVASRRSGVGVSHADDTIGEVQVRGPGVFSGYRNLPDKTAAAFTDDGWFRTEDLGFIDGRGCLHLLGRSSTLIVTAAGENIQPERLETQYQGSPLIREVGVLQQDSRLCAVIVPDHKAIRSRGATDVEESIRRAFLDVGKKLPSHHRIFRYVISRDALPRTRLGKIRRAELERRFIGIESGRGAAPRALAGPMRPEAMSDDDRALIDEPAARALWDLLCERYPDRGLSPDTSLAVDLGVDSLEWINLTLDIRRRIGAELTEEATVRIETVRDLLNEGVAAETSTMTEAVSSVFENPQRFVNDEQRRWLRPLSRSEVLLARAFYALNKFVMRRLFHLHVVGRENLPRDANVILAPNHMSVLDPFVVAAAVDFERLRDTYWAGWTGMAFANPLFRLVCRLAQVLPIEQDRAAFSSLALSLIVLGEGRSLIWFPEGERSRDGELLRFRKGIGVLLGGRPTRTVPILIEGTFEAMPAGRRFPRLRPLRLSIGQAITAEELETSGSGASSEERIANALHDAVAALKEQPVVTQVNSRSASSGY